MFGSCFRTLAVIAVSEFWGVFGQCNTQASNVADCTVRIWVGDSAIGVVICTPTEDAILPNWFFSFCNGTSWAVFYRLGWDVMKHNHARINCNLQVGWLCITEKTSDSYALRLVSRKIYFPPVSERGTGGDFFVQERDGAHMGFPEPVARYHNWTESTKPQMSDPCQLTG